MYINGTSINQGYNQHTVGCQFYHPLAILADFAFSETVIFKTDKSASTATAVLHSFSTFNCGLNRALCASSE